MVRGLWMLFVVGTSGLHVETDTPDALCPPLESVRDAVRSRLGEVAGGPYEARYALVRGADQGADLLLLTVTGAAGSEVLRRELPVASMACADMADVVALVLERFFEQIRPAQPSTEAGPDGAGEDGEKNPLEADRSEPMNPPQSNLPADGPDVGTTGEVSDEGASHWSLRGGAALPIGGGLGLTVGASYEGLPWGTFIVDGSFPVVQQRHAEEDLAILSASTWLFGSSLFLVEVGGWSFGAGPAVALQVERAEIVESSLADGRKTRLIPGVGVHGLIRVELAPRLELELGVRAAPLFAGVARRFVVLDNDGNEAEVLRPAGRMLVGSLGLNLRL